jgi:polysaccharide pyruvyl transferase WcaK-like protein
MREIRNILVFDPPSPRTKAGIAIAQGLIKLLGCSFPDAEITFLSSWPKTDRELYKNSSIKIREHPWIIREERGRFRKLLSFPLLFLRSNYDVVIHLDSDRFDERAHGSVFTLLSLLSSMLSFAMFRAPHIEGPCTIGGFTSLPNRLLAKILFSKYKLILAREKLTKSRLLEFGLPDTKVKIVPDPAFLFEPISAENAASILTERGFSLRESLIGINPSGFIPRFLFPEEMPSEKPKRFWTLMALVADFCVEEWGAEVCLIPHSLVPWENDEEACVKIYERVSHKDKIRPISGKLRADEIKGIISLCELFVASRMHAAIASVSTCVPTICLTYGKKFEGIIGEMCGLEDYLVKGEGQDLGALLEALKTKLRKASKEQREIREKLKMKVQEINKMAFLYGDFVKEALNK